MQASHPRGEHSVRDAVDGDEPAPRVGYRGHRAPQVEERTHASKWRAAPPRKVDRDDGVTPTPEGRGPALDVHARLIADEADRQRFVLGRRGGVGVHGSFRSGGGWPEGYRVDEPFVPYLSLRRS